MKIKKPDFWDEKKPNFIAYLLLPLSKIIEIFSEDKVDIAIFIPV